MDSMVTIWIAYQAIIFLPAMLCLWFGYRLLVKGLFDGEPNIITAWGNNRRLILKRSMPGIVFSLVGLALMLMNVNSDVFMPDPLAVQARELPPAATESTSTIVTGSRDAQCQGSILTGISSCSFAGEYIDEIQSVSR
ncbi:hypothetical protein PKO51_20920 [Yokenella regensburgei]|uniref:hypothetical protein n=1 Tax=Yokenella regensburgei TaxID=158877 RepID=UPI0027D9C4E7|nr:hypothetical protein [Yokenella regensburgei]MDQ4431802.1 hypothetical protein [Yokenella regensburgei]